MTIISTQNQSEEKSLYISIKDVQAYYFPMLSLKKIRKLVKQYVHTIKVGNKYLINREQLETLLHDPNIRLL